MGPSLFIATTLLFFTSPLLAIHHLSANTDANDLAHYTQCIFLPYNRTFSSRSNLTVLGSSDGEPFTFPVDTGSTSLMIGEPLLPSVNLAGTSETEYERG
jgi:hypothetical protein